MTPNLPTEAQCRRQSSIFDRALPHVFDYARRKRLVNAPFAQFAELEEEWQKYPENWEENVLGMLAGNAVCGSRERCAGLVRSVKDRIPEDEIALLRGWRTVPWTWTVLQVGEDLGESRLVVRPLGSRPAQWPDTMSWEELHLYSPAVARSFHQGKTLVLAFLVRIDAIFHTYGVVLPFTSFDERDMLGYADMVRAATLQQSRGIVEPVAGDSDRVSDLNEVIRHAPLDFLRLFAFSDAPTLTGREGLWRFYRAAALVHDPHPVSDADFWKEAVAANGHAVASSDFAEDAAALFLDGGRPMYDPTVYVSFGDRRVFLHATTDHAYRAGREALAGIVQVPPAPPVSVSLLMATAASSILGDYDEISYLQSAFDPALEDEAAEPDSETMETMRRIIDRLTHNHNEAIEESDAAIARKLVVDEELVAEIREQMPFANDSTPAAGGAHRLDTMGLAPRPFRELIRAGVPQAEGALVMRTPESMIAAGEQTVASLAATPIVQFARWLLVQAADLDSIPATQAGYVKPEIVTRAIEAGAVRTPLERERSLAAAMNRTFSEEELAQYAHEDQPKKEADWPDFHTSRKLMERAGLIALDRRSFRVTDLARSLVESPARLYHAIATTVFETYEWDQAQYIVSVPGLRDYAGFLLYALERLSREAASDDEGYGWVSAEDFLAAYTGAYPPLADALARPEVYEGVYPVARQVATGVPILLDRAFGNRLGLMEYEHRVDRSRLRATAVFPRVFEIDGRKES